MEALSIVADGDESLSDHDVEHDYDRSDLLVMSRASLVRLVLQHQAARWFERVGTRGTLQTIEQLRAAVFTGERELEAERRECARLRIELGKRP